MILKICKICNTEKPETEFSKNRNRKDNLHYNCKPCDSAKTREWLVKNKEKSKERKAEYRKINKERISETSKEKYKLNKEKILLARKGYYERNKNKVLKNVLSWRERNKEKPRVYLRKHYLNHKHEYLVKAAKRRAAKLNATPAWLTAIQQAQIQEMYDVALACTVQTGIRHHVDHIHPLQGDGFTGLHVPWNLRVIPGKENISKGCRLPVEDAHLAWTSMSPSPVASPTRG